MSTPLEKERGFVGWIRVGVSVSASGVLTAVVVVVVVVVAVIELFVVMSMAETSREGQVLSNKR